MNPHANRILTRLFELASAPAPRPPARSPSTFELFAREVSQADALRLARLTVKQHRAAKARWPDIDLTEADLARHIIRVLPGSSSWRIDHWVAALHRDDLFLAAACLRGIPGAQRALQDEHGQILASALGRAPARQRGRLTRALREHLFVGDDARPAHLFKYRGMTSLGAWLHVASIRYVLGSLRSSGA